MSAKNWLKFIIYGLIIGSSFLWIKIGLRELGPIALVVFQTGIATLGLLIVVLAKGVRFQAKELWVLAILGLFNVAVPFVLISWSETHISSGMASILNSTVPLLTILIAPLFLREEQMTWRRIIGLLLGFGGVVVLVSNQLVAGDRQEQLGFVTMLLAACFYAGSSIFARRMTHQMPAEVQSLGQIGTAFLYTLLLAVILEAPLRLPHYTISYVALIWLGLFGSCGATLLWFSLLHAVGPTRVSMTTYMFPLVGVVLGAVFLGESVDWRVLVGGGLIILAIVLVNLRENSLASSNEVL